VSRSRRRVSPRNGAAKTDIDRTIAAACRPSDRKHPARAAEQRRGVRADAAKSDAAKTDPTKADATKSDAAKIDPTKAAATKSGAAKTDQAKPDAAKTMR
jgi:hypothetical protein